MIKVIASLLFFFAMLQYPSFSGQVLKKTQAHTFRIPEIQKLPQMKHHLCIGIFELSDQIKEPCIFRVSAKGELMSEEASWQELFFTYFPQFTKEECKKMHAFQVLACLLEHKGIFETDTPLVNVEIHLMPYDMLYQRNLPKFDIINFSFGGIDGAHKENFINDHTYCAALNKSKFAFLSSGNYFYPIKSDGVNLINQGIFFVSSLNCRSQLQDPSRAISLKDVDHPLLKGHHLQMWGGDLDILGDGNLISGTSFASPLMVRIVAHFLSAYPYLNPTHLQQCIDYFGPKNFIQKGKDVTFEWGVLGSPKDTKDPTLTFNRLEIWKLFFSNFKSISSYFPTLEFLQTDTNIGSPYTLFKANASLHNEKNMNFLSDLFTAIINDYIEIFHKYAAYEKKGLYHSNSPQILIQFKKISALLTKTTMDFHYSQEALTNLAIKNIKLPKILLNPNADLHPLIEFLDEVVVNFILEKLATSDLSRTYNNKPLVDYYEALLKVTYASSKLNLKKLEKLLQEEGKKKPRAQKK